MAIFPMLFEVSEDKGWRTTESPFFDTRYAPQRMQLCNGLRPDVVLGYRPLALGRQQYKVLRQKPHFCLLIESISILLAPLAP
jgi:hypothetical protein